MNPMVSQVKNELIEVLRLYKNATSNPATLTINGKTYEVSNVEEMEDGTWQVSQFVSRGMFLCNQCPDNDKYQPGDQWLRFKCNGKVVTMYSLLIHLFVNHPENIPEQDIKNAAAVFID